jgi:hypothetical protein
LSEFAELIPFYDCPTSDTMVEFHQRFKIFLKPSDKSLHVLLDRVHKKDPSLSKQVGWVTLSISEAYLIQSYLNKAILALGGL